MCDSSPSVSIIVPTYNEETTIGPLLDNLAALRPKEILVVDGGSSDRTVEIASQRVRVLRTQTSRALQMNAGARAAGGDVLLFLHADARLEPEALDPLREAMREPQVPGGNFDIVYEGGDRVARTFTSINRWRRRAGILYGDSGIFCRRAVFELLGGYRPWPILEDYDFGRRLWKVGRLALLSEPIRVSDRRWRNGGLLPTLWSWLWIQGLHVAGVSPHRLAGMYRHIR